MVDYNQANITERTLTGYGGGKPRSSTRWSGLFDYQQRKTPIRVSGLLLLRD